MLTGNLDRYKSQHLLRPKDLGVSVLERSVTGTVHLSLYNKFPLFLHADDEEQSNVKDSIRDSIIRA